MDQRERVGPVLVDIKLACRGAHRWASGRTCSVVLRTEEIRRRVAGLESTACLFDNGFAVAPFGELFDLPTTSGGVPLHDEVAGDLSLGTTHGQRIDVQTVSPFVLVDHSAGDFEIGL